MLRIISLGVISIFYLVLFLQFEDSHSGYVTYNPQNTSYSNSTYIGSVPYTSSGFYYSDPSGNSISVRNRQAVPIIINQYNVNAIWVWANNGNVPGSAIVLQYINGFPVFYCRIIQNNRLFYGKLVPRQGCYIPSISPRAFSVYQVLIR